MVQLVKWQVENIIQKHASDVRRNNRHPNARDLKRFPAIEGPSPSKRRKNRGSIPQPHQSKPCFDAVHTKDSNSRATPSTKSGRTEWGRADQA